MINNHISINYKFLFHLTVFFICTFFLGKLTPFAPLTPYGMNVAGVLLGVIYAWIFIDIIWPSMIGLVAIAALDIMPVTELFSKGFGNSTTVMMLFIFVFTAILDKNGVTKWISMRIMSAKWVENKPWLLTFIFLFAVSILAGLSCATPTTIIGWSLLYNIFNVCNYKKREGYTIMMVIGVVFASQLGMTLIPFKGLPLIIISSYEKISQSILNYPIYMCITFSSCVLCLLAFILIGKFIFRPDLSKLKNLDIKTLITENEMKLSKIQKILLVFLFAFMMLMILPCILPDTLAFSVFLKKIGNPGSCIFLVALLCMIKIDNKSLCPWKTMVNEGVAWHIIFIISFIIPLSSSVSNPQSGITDFILYYLTPFFKNSSTLVFLMCLGIIIAVLIQFINNTATGVIFVTIAYTFTFNNNSLAELSVILTTICCSFAFLTPASSAAAALLHNNIWVTTKDIWKIAPILIAAEIIIATTTIISASKIIYKL